MNNRLENRISEIKREIAQLDLRKSEFVTSEEKIAKLKIILQIMELPMK